MPQQQVPSVLKLFSIFDLVLRKWHGYTFVDRPRSHHTIRGAHVHSNHCMEGHQDDWDPYEGVPTQGRQME